MGDVGHRNRDEMLEWVGGRFDAAGFDPKSIEFEDPRKRWELAFGGRSRRT